ncbi:methyltransferase domain-containing protein [Aerophototrophica crusticola]|uniref:Methyltransferase domain-containing protein n=1 Tax=Aerophototrophica crusticola TaxID=1709002 RepID=A0A858R6C9_9PROT|nr:methyltransferase domain-containing protein [Rhodospirillaceae bacterium B3]
MAPGGDGQVWDAGGYGRDYRFVADMARDLLGWLDPKPGERILDLGAGDGELTAAIAATGASVLAVDGSASMVEACRARGLDARVVDGQSLPFRDEFDAVFSNAALHWMTDVEAVAAGVFQSLKPGGRFVAEMGGAGNVRSAQRALIEALDRRGLDGAAADPWVFPSIGEYSCRLEEAGFRVEQMLLFPRPTPVPAGVRAWLETFGGSFTALLPKAERGPYLDEVAAAIEPGLTGPDGTAVLDYVRLRFRAVRP